MNFTIQGELPGLNEVIDACKRRRGNWSAYSTMKAAQTDRIMGEFMVQGIKPPAVYHPVTIRFHWVNRSMRRDLDNIAAGKKFILDAMVKSGLLKNDTQEHVKGFSDTFGLDRENPRVEVTVEIDPLAAFPMGDAEKKSRATVRRYFDEKAKGAK